MAAPSKAGDQFIVWAPPADMAKAIDAADTIRQEDFLGAYEDKLSIPRVGQPGQTGRFQVLLDPDFHSALPGADGVEAARCEIKGADAAAVWPGLSGEEFHATLAHELFHAAQANLAGDFQDNWWYEATATWVETRFGYETPDPRSFSRHVTDHPNSPMDTFLKAIDGADSHEYGAWTFVAWLFFHGKMSWSKMRQSFIEAAHADPTPILDQLVSAGPSTLADQVASYWADHLNPLPRFGPTAKITVIHDSDPTHVYHEQTARYLGAKTFAVKPGANKGQMVLIFKDLPAGVQVWIKTGPDQFWTLDKGDDFNETFCRKGASAGSLELPANGEVRIAMTTTGKSAPAEVHLKVITSHDPCPRHVDVVPGLAIGSLHLGMTEAEAKAAAPRHHLFGELPTPEGKLRPGAFNVDGVLVTAEFLNGRIAALLASGPRVRTTTTGIFGAAFNLSRPPPGTDDLAKPILIPGSTLEQFGEEHCHKLPHTKPPSRFCWHEGPPSRYTYAAAGLVDPCPTDAGPDDHDHDSDMPVCNYPKDWYVGGLAVSTQRAFKLIPYVLKFAKQH